MVPPIENYIGKMPSVFMSKQAVINGQNMSYADMVFSMVTKTLGDQTASTPVTELTSSEYEMRKALSLCMSLLLNCKGMLDNYLSGINDIVLGQLSKQVNAEVPLTRISLLIVLGAGLLYNPQLQLAELEKRGVVQTVFPLWLNDAQQMDKWLARKMTVVGFCSMLQLPSSSWPSSLIPMIPQIITTITALTGKIEEDAKIPDDEDRSPFLEVGPEDEAEDVVGFDEDEDVHDVADDAYLEALKTATGADDGDLARFLMGDIWPGGEDDDDDDFVSPLDDIETVKFYKDALSSAFGREPAFFQQVQEAMAPEAVQMCQQLFAMADSKAQSG